MSLYDVEANLKLNSSGYDKGISDAIGKGKKFAGLLGNGFSKAAKVAGKAVAIAGAGISTVVGQSVSEFGEYEQLVGGVETLFKNSSDTVQKYAANAYKTAGMSANDYMETVTGFSASLIQSLDGDTTKAAEVGNRAIEDMSD